MSSTPSQHYLNIKTRHPAFVKAVESLGEIARQEGPLDEKTSQLVQLGAAAAIRSEGAVHSHTNRALDAGASAEEIHHAIIILTNTIGFPNVMAAISWADDIILGRNKNI
jgi:AhpD family alkylhydroperoxidase